MIARLSGYALRWGNGSDLLAGNGRRFVETFIPHCFRNLTERGIQVLYDHDDGKVLARSPDTLSISSTDLGLRVTIDLEDNALNRSIRGKCCVGTLRGLSVRFRVLDEEYRHNRAGPDYRWITRAELLEVSLTECPAYPDSRFFLMR